MAEKKQPQKIQPKLPDLEWKTAVCEVCGEIFEYFAKKKPHTCKNGECRYRFDHKINPHTWASYQPTLFDVSNK
nr:hypothetical protein [candidate division Zixibacteria bacterium]